MNNVLFCILLILILVIYLHREKEEFDSECIPYSQLNKSPNLDKSVAYPDPIKYILQSTDEATMQTHDPSGTSSDVSEYTECKTCEPGEFITGQGCTRCPENEISTEANSWSCTACEEGQYTNGLGDTECRDF